MTCSGSESSGLAKGMEFCNEILYVQHLDLEKDVISEIPELLLEDYILQDRQKFCHLEFTAYSENPKSNIEILKSGIQCGIQEVSVHSNSLPIRPTLEKYSFRAKLKLPRLPSFCDLMIHAFVVFKTYDIAAGKNMWWSLEKNGHHIVLQHSPHKMDVVEKVYDIDKKELAERLGPVREETRAKSFFKLINVFTTFWGTCQFSTKYNLIKANCQNFASFVYSKTNCEGKTWSTITSGLVDRLTRGKPENSSGVDANAIRHYWILKSDRRNLYMPLIENKEFSEVLLEDFSINGRDSQGYTLLEWCEAFSRNDVRNYLEANGAIESKLFRRNVLFIALQYLDSEDELQDPKLFFDGIDTAGVNETGDTALHLALYGAKWKIANKLLNDIENSDLNSINCLNEIPLHLAAKLESCPIEIFQLILNRMNPELVNNLDHFEYSPLHYAVDVRSPDKNKIKLLLDRGADINLKSIKGYTALHFALFHKSEDVALQLLSHVKRVSDDMYVEDADVDLKDNSKKIALHYACWWSDIPAKLFKKILKKSCDFNGQDKFGRTALVVALINLNKIATKQLLKFSKKRMDGTDERVNVNIPNNENQTALHWAAAWPKIPKNGFQKILDNTQNVNAKDNSGRTAFDFAKTSNSMNAIQSLLGKK